MKVILDKNIKYRGETYKKGERISIDKEHLEEFISKKVVDKGSMEELERMKELQATEDDSKEEKEDGHVPGIDDFTKDMIVKVLTENGIEHNNRDKKEILYELMIENAQM